MKSPRVTIRIKDRYLMIIKELAQKSSTTQSIVIRALLYKVLDNLIDDEGNIKKELIKLFIHDDAMN